MSKVPNWGFPARYPIGAWFWCIQGHRVRCPVFGGVPNDEADRALWLLRREHSCWRNVKVRTCKYLNNVVEQDHRAIKRRRASMAGFKSFTNVAITIAGIELAHRIR